MKRFWLVLLSLGLIVAFSTSAMAVDVKFSGEYYAAGMYLDKTSMNATPYDVWGVRATNASTRFGAGFPAAFTAPFYEAYKTGTQQPGQSTAFYFQRLRLNTTFIVHPGLFLVTRADIMERAWGAVRSTTGSSTTTTRVYHASATTPGPNNFTGEVYTKSSTVTVGAPLDSLSAGTRAENENIAFDLLYAMYISPVGMFMVGYQIDSAWGTVFGDNSQPTPRITYVLPIKGFQIGLMTGKVPDGERSKTAIFNSSLTDGDSSFYTAYIKYTWKTGEVGLLGKYIRNAISRNAYSAYTAYAGLAAFDGGVFAANGGLVLNTAELSELYATGVKVDQYAVLPYFKAQLGPVALQGEIIYVFGKIAYEGRQDLLLHPYINATGAEFMADVKMDMFNAWIDATADFGVAYVGGSLAYLAGDDIASTDKKEGGATGGIDWNPCLIMFNNDLNYWAGAQAGYTGTSNGAMSNAYFAQVRAGVRPVDKLDIMGSLSWAKADKTPAHVWESRDYGWEVDLTATYKITNNLSYMLGGAYFFTGDFYKGGNQKTVFDPNDVRDIDDNFMIINKLTLTF